MTKGMNSMENEIKRMAQFLFDNADFIASQMEMTERYRSISLQMTHFKKDSKSTTFGIYDENSTHHQLEGDFISIENFKSKCIDMNRRTGDIESPAPVEIRENLEIKEE